MKTIISNILCILLIQVCSLHTLAQKISTSEIINENVIALHHANGTIITYAFEEKPVISYSGEELVITTNSASVQFPLSNLRKLTLEGDWNNVNVTAIDDAVVPDTEFSFSEEGTKVSGEKPGTPFYVFDAQGTKCTEGVIDAEGKANIQLSNLPKGIYVVKTQSTSFKVKK